MNHFDRYSARTEEKIYNFYLQIVKVCGTLSKLEKEERRNKPVSSIRIPQRTYRGDTTPSHLSGFHREHIEEIQPCLINPDSIENIQRRYNPVSFIRIPQRTLEEIQPRLIYQDSIENIQRRYKPVSSIRIPQRKYRVDTTPSHLSGFHIEHINIKHAFSMDQKRRRFLKISKTGEDVFYERQKRRNPYFNFSFQIRFALKDHSKET